MTPKFTHKGWYWFCPIYLTLDAHMHVRARHWAFDPLFAVADGLEWLRINASLALYPNYQPSFMFLVTGEIS